MPECNSYDDSSYWYSTVYDKAMEKAYKESDTARSVLPPDLPPEERDGPCGRKEGNDGEKIY